jgi:hypothetical protein
MVQRLRRCGLAQLARTPFLFVLSLVFVIHKWLLRVFKIEELLEEGRVVPFVTPSIQPHAAAS